MAGSPVRQPMNEPRVSVISKNDGFVASKDFIEIFICEAVRMLARRLQRHEVDHIDDPHSQIGQVLSEKRSGRQRL